MKKRQKERGEENTLGQVSLPKELLAISKAYAKKKGLSWAAFVRTLIISELEKSGVESTSTKEKPTQIDAVSKPPAQPSKPKKFVGFRPYDKRQNLQQSA